MPLYRDEAVVLRTQKLGEADRIVTLLTRRHGRVRAVAKGVRRTGSRFGSRVEPFMHVDLQLHEGRSLDVVTQAETIEPYGERIANDYARYTAGTAVLETAERLTSEEREPAIRLFEKFRFRHYRTREFSGKELVYFYLDLYAGGERREENDE